MSWHMFNDAYISMVAKDCRPDELMVRARRPGDIEKLFPDLKGLKVTEFTASDYHYRAAIKITEIDAMFVREVRRVVYNNFKNSVRDHDLHNAYMDVWTTMAKLQPKPPYSGIVRGKGGSYFGIGADLFLDDFGVEHLKPKQGQVVAKVGKAKGSKKLVKGQ